MRDARPSPPAPGAAATRSASAGAGRDAVDGDAAAHEVVARGPGTSSAPPSWPRGRAGRTHAGASERRRARRRTASSCSRGVRVVGLVGDREVGADALEAQLAVRRRSTRPARTASAGAQPTRCMPVSTLRCTGSGSARRVGDRLRERVDAGGGVHDGREAAGDDGGRGRGGGGSDSTRIGASMPASRSSTPSSTSATPSHVGAGVERGARRPAPRRARSRRPSRPR